MKVLMISGDRYLLEAGTEAHARLVLQRAQVEQLDVFVWPQVHSRSEIMRAARATAYDVVTAQDPFWRGLVARRAARVAGARLNLQVHTDLSAQPLFRRLLARFLLRRADSVRVVSERVRAQVQALGVTAPIHVLPVYVDVSRFEKVVREPHTQKTILWVGRFEKEKDPLRAVSVLKEVRTTGVDAKLVMLGSGMLESELRQQSAGLSVEFPGWQDTVRYLPTADLVLCTSLHESWGASIVEALAAGVPVVAPDVGIAKEAGATIASRAELTGKVIETLRAGQRGELKLFIPSAEEWAERWLGTLINNKEEPVLNALRVRIPRPVRYIVSGGTAAVVNIGILFVLTHFAGIWYLASSVIAFLVAFFVSFILQRTWTFDQRTTDGLARHTSLYFIVTTVNTFVNTALVFSFVEYAHIWYIAAQVIAGALIAFASFFIYRKIFV
ncbi:MAG: glycosyltransferase [Patescibacteria group bacterium]|nr:glycosyltransferase [Patescibacteria group bacterium]